MVSEDCSKLSLSVLTWFAMLLDQVDVWSKTKVSMLALAEQKVLRGSCVE